MQSNSVKIKDGKEVPFEAYFSALLDRRNRPTASYYYAQKVNAEIKQYQNIFLTQKISK